MQKIGMVDAGELRKLKWVPWMRKDKEHLESRRSFQFQLSVDVPVSFVTHNRV